MATQSDIIVKKADAATNITWSAVVRSAGDKIAAVWKSVTASVNRAFQPTASQVAYDNGPKTARRVISMVKFPVVRNVAGVDVVVHTVHMELTGLIPNELTAAETAEAVEQSINIFASTQFRSSYLSGYSPN